MLRREESFVGREVEVAIRTRIIPKEHFDSEEGTWDDVPRFENSQISSGLLRMACPIGCGTYVMESPNLFIAGVEKAIRS
jgi:hypothetical protein